MKGHKRTGGLNPRPSPRDDSHGQDCDQRAPDARRQDVFTEFNLPPGKPDQARKTPPTKRPPTNRPL